MIPNPSPRDRGFCILFGTLHRAATNCFRPWRKRPVNLSPISYAIEPFSTQRVVVVSGQPAEIDPEAPLYDEGLGLDSIDMLEIALAVSKEFGVKLRADDKSNERIFSSLRSLNHYIQQNRAN